MGEPPLSEGHCHKGVKGTTITGGERRWQIFWEAFHLCQSLLVLALSPAGGSAGPPGSPGTASCSVLCALFSDMLLPRGSVSARSPGAFLVGGQGFGSPRTQSP